MACSLGVPVAVTKDIYEILRLGVIKMTNDLMTELQTLGTALATNLTNKGVTASYTDGLTTLANKVLQISGGGGGSTVIYQPSLDGTESKYQIQGTTTISNGVMSGGSGYLSTGWDNSIDWKLTFELRFDTQNDCGVLIIPNTVTSRDYNEVMILPPQQTSLWVRYQNGGSQFNSTSRTITTDTWYEVTVTFIDDDLRLQMFGTDTTVSASYLRNFANMALGVDSWGGSASIRNIKVETIGGSDCSQYQTEISNAIEYINGSGT